MTSVLKLAELRPGTGLPEWKRMVTQECIDHYAKASGDFNPIHIDPEFARKTPLGGTIAHGMLVLAYISEFQTGIFGQSWFTGGQLSVRFKSPARPGDTLTISGTVTKVENTGSSIVVSSEII